VSFITMNMDAKVLLPVLTRIADALDRLIPMEPIPENVSPEEAVTYVDEQAIARQEELDEMGEEARRLEEWLREHPEEAEDVQQHRD
jgi:hypothetical protein